MLLLCKSLQTMQQADLWMHFPAAIEIISLKWILRVHRFLHHSKALTTIKYLPIIMRGIKLKYQISLLCRNATQ